MAFAASVHGYAAEDSLVVTWIGAGKIYDRQVSTQQIFDYPVVRLDDGSWAPWTWVALPSPDAAIGGELLSWYELQRGGTAVLVMNRAVLDAQGDVVAEQPFLLTPDAGLFNVYKPQPGDVLKPLVVLMGESGDAVWASLGTVTLGAPNAGEVSFANEPLGEFVMTTLFAEDAAGNSATSVHLVEAPLEGAYCGDGECSKDEYEGGPGTCPVDCG
jgi:hypothetical protein